MIIILSCLNMVAEGIGGQASGAVARRRRATLLVYIYKEGLSRTVVREVLQQATAHGHQTFPDYGRHTRSRSKGGDVREEAPAEERAAKNLQTNVRHVGCTEKIYGFPRSNSSRERRRKATKRSQPSYAVPHINIR